MLDLLPMSFRIQRSDVVETHGHTLSSLASKSWMTAYSYTAFSNSGRPPELHRDDVAMSFAIRRV